MPRLGGTGNDDDARDDSRGLNSAAPAYPRGRSSASSFAIFRIISLVLTFSILRNMMTKDYRSGEIDYLRKSGVDEEQISKYIPETNTEVNNKRQKSRTEYEQMKVDLLVLQKQMQEIRTHVGLLDDNNNNNVENTTATATSSITTTTAASSKKEEDMTANHKGNIIATDKTAVVESYKDFKQKKKKLIDSKKSKNEEKA